jgi:hypothetical protein
MFPHALACISFFRVQFVIFTLVVIRESGHHISLPNHDHHLPATFDSHQEKVRIIKENIGLRRCKGQP